MKILQRVQMSLASLGYRPSRSPFNETHLWTFFKASLALSSICAYTVCEAHTSKEYMDSVFMITVVVVINITRAGTICKSEVVFVFIDKLEKIMNGSKLNFYVYSNNLKSINLKNGISFQD